jgi:hypothetical protein
MGSSWKQPLAEMQGNVITTTTTKHFIPKQVRVG